MITKPSKKNLPSSLQLRQPLPHLDLDNLSDWYLKMANHKAHYLPTPSYLPQRKESQPYQLKIQKISGISTIKKVLNMLILSAVNSLHLSMKGYLISRQVQIFGGGFELICEEKMAKMESKYEGLECLYYHSRVDRNDEQTCLMIEVFALELNKNEVVESKVFIGNAFITAPFQEQESQDVALVHSHATEYLTLLPIPNLKSSTFLTFSIQSSIQLKPLLKLIPENQIVTHQTHIGGIINNSLPPPSQPFHVSEASSIQILITFLQIQIPDKFDQEVLLLYKKINTTNADIKSRKIYCGFHNQFQLVRGTMKKLEKIKDEIIGQSKIQIFEASTEKEVIRVNYYLDELNVSAFVVSLIYEIDGKQVEVGLLVNHPSQKMEINESMFVGSGFGSVGALLPVVCSLKPTIILDLESEAVEQKTYQQFAPGLKNNVGSNKDQKEKLMQELEEEKMQLEKEKEEMQRLQLHQASHLEQEYETKFNQEKIALHKKQQLLEEQYREQIQKEVQDKFRLEEEIRLMKEQLKLEDKKKSSRNSYQNSIYAENEHAQKEKLSPEQRKAPEKIEPLYLLQQEHTIPVEKVRQLLEREKGVSKELLKQAYDQFQYASKLTIILSSIRWAEGVDCPKQFYVIIRLFNFHEFRTDNLAYSDSGNSKDLKLIRSKGSCSEDEPVYSFTIDPSESSEPSVVQIDFTNFLLRNTLILDLFDANSHLYLGQANVKLQGLIRGNKSEIIIANEYQVIKLNSQPQQAAIQILIRNQEQFCKNHANLKGEPNKTSKKKVVSNNPIRVVEQEKADREKANHQNHVKSLQEANPDFNRQEMRIQHFKDQRILRQNQHSLNHWNNDSPLLLNQILEFKEKKKKNYIKHVYEDLLNDPLRIHAYFAQATTFPYQFTNHSQSPSSFKVTIFCDQDANQPELQLVKDAHEWKYWVEKKNYEEPRMEEMISSKDTFWLNGGESIPLVFRYLSWDRQKTSEKVLHVTIVKEQTNFIVSGFTLYVTLHSQVINHSYILFEPSNSVVDVIIPVVFAKHDGPNALSKIHVTSQNQAHWMSPTQILLQIETPAVMHKSVLNVLIYQDNFFHQLQENWLVEVHSYEGVCANVRTGYGGKFKIVLPATAVHPPIQPNSFSASSALRLFCSNPGVIIHEERIEVNARFGMERAGYQIWCEILWSEQMSSHFEITCVGQERRDLVYGWTVQVYAYVGS